MIELGRKLFHSARTNQKRFLTYLTSRVQSVQLKVKKVCHLYTVSNVTTSLDDIYKQNEKKKFDLYEEMVWEVENAMFSSSFTEPGVHLLGHP